MFHHPFVVANFEMLDAGCQMLEVTNVEHRNTVIPSIQHLTSSIFFVTNAEETTWIERRCFQRRSRIRFPSTLGSIAMRCSSVKTFL